MDQDFYSPSPQYLAACCRAERQGEPHATCLERVLTKPEAHQSEGGLLLLYHFNVEMATAQFRFVTPTACGGELHSDPLTPEQVAEKIIQICGKA